MIITWKIGTLYTGYKNEFNALLLHCDDRSMFIADGGTTTIGELEKLLNAQITYKPLAASPDSWMLENYHSAKIRFLSYTSMDGETTRGVLVDAACHSNYVELPWRVGTFHTMQIAALEQMINGQIKPIEVVDDSQV